MINLEYIKQNLKKDAYFEYKDITESTNDDVSSFINDIRYKEHVVIAGEQTKGRGRLDHTFLSPKGGIYLSILKDISKVPQESFSLITPIVALATYKAIKKVLNKETDIKWINDLLYNDKKVCGILCELSKDYKHVIIGIGIDYKQSLEDIAPELKDIIGALSSESEEDLSNELIIALINNINSLIDKLPGNAFLKEYKAHCVTIGKDISFMYNNELKFAKALDIISNGELLVEDKDGKHLALNSGEVSIIRNI